MPAMDSDGTRADSSPRPATEAPAREWIDRVIDGRYRIVERLGEGGMGAVFVAEHMQLHKRVALKTIHPQFAGHQEMAARFAREAMTSAHIEHPNVTSALDFGALPEGGAYLVMQLVRGPSLRDQLDAHGALKWVDACHIAAQIADALVAAHASGVVHRDLKPENVILMPNEEGPPTVKVLDFGIAHVKAHNMTPSPAGKPLTQVGVVIGTPGYMPPEQAMGQTVDERADLYALGVMLWEMVSGKRPFEGASFSEIMVKQVQNPAPDLASGMAPEGLRELVRSMLKLAPGERPATASSVRDTLRVLTLGQEATRFALPFDTATAAKILSMRSQTVQTWVGRVPTPWRYAALCVGLAVMAVVWSFSSAPGQKVEPEPAPSVQTPVATKSLAKRKAPVVEKTPEPPAVEPEPVAEPVEEELEPAARVEEPTSDDTRTTHGSRRGHKRAASRESADKSAGEKPSNPRPVQRLKRALDDLFH
jgi:serine/threonine protein kinase